MSVITNRGKRVRCFAQAVVVAIAAQAATAAPVMAITTFGAAKPVSSKATLDFCTDTLHCSNDGDPAIAADNNGVLIVVWDSVVDLNGVSGASPHILFVRSMDNGNSWSDPAYLDAFATSPPYTSDRPRISEDGHGNWIAAWLGSGHWTVDPPLTVLRSTDAGQTWTSTFPDQLIPSSWGYELHADRTTGTTVLVQSYENKTRMQRTVDGGATWRDVNELNAGDRYGSNLAISSDGNGTWLTVYTPDEGNVQIARSTDDAATWSSFTSLPEEGSGSALAYDPSGAGTWFMATKGHMYSLYADLISVTKSIDGGQTWTAPVRIAANTGYEKSLALLVKGQSRLELVASTSGTLVGAGADWDLASFRSDDGGATWSRARALTGSARGNADAYGYSADYAPVVIESGGSTIVAWLSHESLRFQLGYGIDLGTDSDVLFAIGSERCNWQPREDCRRSTMTGASSLKIKQSTNGAQALRWLWKKGASTPVEDFGDPTSETNYSLCLYATEPNGSRLIVEQHMDTDGSCRFEDCWQIRSSGYAYGDGSLISGGVRRVSLKPGSDGAAAISLQASGPSLGLPPQPLTKVSALRVQLVNERDDRCWESRFNGFDSNSEKDFSARGD